MKDKKAAKKLIKLAKKHPDWYTKQEAWYAKLIKDESNISKRNTRSGKDYGLRSESEQPKQPRQSSGSWFVGLLHKARSLVGL